MEKLSTVSFLPYFHHFETNTEKVSHKILIRNTEALSLNDFEET